jgi:hypothetical protein
MPRNTSDFHEVQLLERQLRNFKPHTIKIFRDNARKTLIEPVVREAKARFRTGSPFGVHVAPTIRGVYPTTGFPGIRAGGSGLGGLLFYGAEFGGGKRVRTYQTTSRSGNRYMVTRHTTRQFPRWYSGGRFLYPTVRAHGPRIAAEWARLTLADFSLKKV